MIKAKAKTKQQNALALNTSCSDASVCAKKKKNIQLRNQTRLLLLAHLNEQRFERFETRAGKQNAKQPHKQQLARARLL